MQRALALLGVLTILLLTPASADRLAGTTIIDVYSTCSVSVYAKDINADVITPYDYITWLYTEYRLIPIADENVEQFVYDVYRMALSTGDTEAVPSTAVVLVNSADHSQKILYLPIIVIPRKLGTVAVCDVKYRVALHDFDVSAVRELRSVSPSVVSDQFEAEIGGVPATVVIAFDLKDPAYSETYPGTDVRFIDYISYRVFLPKYGGIAPRVVVSPADKFSEAIISYWMEHNRYDLIAELEKTLTKVRNLIHLERYPLYVRVPEPGEIEILYEYVAPEVFRSLAEIAPYTFEVGAKYAPPYVARGAPADLSRRLSSRYSTSAHYVVTFRRPAEVNVEAPGKEKITVRDLLITHTERVYVRPGHPGTFILRVRNPNDVNAHVTVCIWTANAVAEIPEVLGYRQGMWCAEEVLPPRGSVEYELNVLYVTAPEGATVKYGVDVRFRGPGLLSEIYKHYGGEVDIRASYYGYKSFCLDENHLAIVERQSYVKQVLFCGAGNRCYQISKWEAICYDHRPLPGELVAKKYREQLERKGDLVGFLLFGSSGMVATAIELLFDVKLGALPWATGLRGLLVAIGVLALAYFIYKTLPEDCPLKNYSPILSLIAGFVLGATGVLALNALFAVLCYLRKS